MLELWLEEFEMPVTLVKCQKVFYSSVPETAAQIISVREGKRAGERELLSHML
jgi:hypothetical protein